MKVRNTQSDPCRNPDPPRVHGLRLTINSHSLGAFNEFESSQKKVPCEIPAYQPALSDIEATLSSGNGTGYLLTVQEVAAILRVPVSWVYGRMRSRSRERLPGYRLGKYWRFQKEEVLTWVASHRRDSHAT